MSSNMRRKSIILGTLFTILLSACTQTMTAEDILKRVIEKYDKAEGYRAEILIITSKSKFNVSVAFKKPNKLRVENPYSITIVNGSKMLIYNKTSGEKRIFELGVNTLSVDLYYSYFLNMLKDGNVSLVGEESVAGERCYVLDAKAGNRIVKIERVWVTRDWRIAKLQFTVMVGKPNETGEITNIFEFKKMEFDKVDDSMFEISGAHYNKTSAELR